MKLDFSALAQPAEKARGQVETTGTPAFTRVCASPLARPGAGTTGDKPAAAVLVADLVVAAPAACPPVSPACPQSADAEKPNAGAVSPVSPLVPVETAQVVAAAPFEREGLAGELATHYGVTGWPEGEATQAASRCFAAWLESFGGTGNREDRALLAQVRGFFETHGASRFEDVGATVDQRIINRAGLGEWGR